MRKHHLALAFVCLVLTSLVIPQAAHAVYPNPFRDTDNEVHFQLSLPKSASVRIQIFDIRGRQIKVIRDEPNHAAGEYDVVWDGRDESGWKVVAGVYVCILVSNGVPVKSVKVIKIGFS